MKKFIALTLLAASLCHAETTIGLHTMSLHIPAHDDQNNHNWGLYVEHDQWVVGGYHNTLSRTSLYAGYEFKVGPFDLFAGAISGYQKKTSPYGYYWIDTPDNGHNVVQVPSVTRGYTPGAVAPILVPSYRLPWSVDGVSARIHYMPGFFGGSQVLHLSIEKSFE